MVWLEKKQKMGGLVAGEIRPNRKKKSSKSDKKDIHLCELSRRKLKRDTIFSELERKEGNCQKSFADFKNYPCDGAPAGKSRGFGGPQRAKFILKKQVLIKNSISTRGEVEKKALVEGKEMPGTHGYQELRIRISDSGLKSGKKKNNVATKSKPRTQTVSNPEGMRGAT